MRTRGARRKRKQEDERRSESAQPEGAKHVRAGSSASRLFPDRDLTEVDEAFEESELRRSRRSPSTGDDDYIADDGGLEQDPEDANFQPTLPRNAGHYKAAASRKRKRAYLQQDNRGGQLSYLRRKIILEMVDQCSGAMPNNTICPSGVFAERLRNAGQTEPFDVNAMKRAIKSLTDSGHLKVLKFSFRSKRGSMVTRAMLVRGEIPGDDPLILQLQRNIIQTEPYEYVPPELGSSLGDNQSVPTPRFSKIAAVAADENSPRLPTDKVKDKDKEAGRKLERLPKRKILHWGTSDDKQPLP
jgi:transcription factor C subunit 3